MINETKRYSMGYIIEAITSLIRSNRKDKAKVNSKKKEVIWYTWS